MSTPETSWPCSDRACPMATAALPEAAAAAMNFECNVCASELVGSERSGSVRPGRAWPEGLDQHNGPTAKGTEKLLNLETVS